jgi:hypothetical protein
MPLPIKPLVSRTILRGPLLRAWTLRQFRRLDKAYCAQLVRASRLPKPEPIRPSVGSLNSVRTILVIADCMWEQNELVPDLRKRWAVPVLDFHPALQKKPSGQPVAETIAKAVRAFAASEQDLEPDVILFYARAPLLSDEVFHDLRKRWKCPIFGMNLDDKATFFNYGIFSERNDNYQRWAGKFDLNLTNTLASVDWYHQLGFPCFYSPQGVNLPAGLGAPGPSTEFQYPLSFVGSNRLDRLALINRLRQLEIPIALFGSGWPESQWAESPTQIYRSSQINLGIGYCTATQTQTTVKGRDFECPGVGACYLTTFNWELACHFEIGKEILCYRSVEELVEMYSYYKKRPEECLKIAQAAFRRSLAEHTWEQRFLKIFRETGLNA